MQIKQGIWANGSDNPAELKHNKICQHREYKKPAHINARRGQKHLIQINTAGYIL